MYGSCYTFVLRLYDCTSVRLTCFVSAVYSGGLDQRIVHWDFAKVKALKVLELSTVSSLCVSFAWGSCLWSRFCVYACVCVSLKTGGATSKQIFNPPMVHRVCVSADGALLAAARGDGDVSVQLHF